MADKVVVVSQQALKPIKLVKWKVNEGNSVSIGCVVLLYEVDEDDKHVVCKLKSTKAGTVHKLLAQEGDVVKPGENLLELQACLHPTVMRDMCAECGADLRKDDTTTSASVPMVHSVPDLKVSVEQAQKIGKADVDRLLKDRKLVLLVDLDQTLIHTTNDNIPANIKDVYHFQLYGAHSPWYHTRLRPGTHRFLENMSPYFELHICTFGARNYAHMIAMFLDQEGKLFSQRILSRDECFNPTSKTANLKALFPCGDEMVCIIDDREDVWSYAANLIHVKPYHFFQHTGDINAPPGLDKHEDDDKEGVDLSKVHCDKQKKLNGTIENNVENDKSSNNSENQKNNVDEAKDDKENTTDMTSNSKDGQVHLEKEKAILVNENNVELTNDVNNKENNVEINNDTSDNSAATNDEHKNVTSENSVATKKNKNGDVQEQNNAKDVDETPNGEKENLPAEEPSPKEDPTKESAKEDPTKKSPKEDPTKERKENAIKENNESMEDSTKKSDVSMEDSTKRSDESVEGSTKKSDEIMEDSTKKSDESVEDSTKKSDEIMEDSTIKSDESVEDSTKKSDEIMEDSTKKSNEGPTKEENIEDCTKEGNEETMEHTTNETNENPTKTESNEAPTKETSENATSEQTTEEEINKKKQDIKTLFKQFNNIDQDIKEDDLIEIEDPDDYLLYLEHILKVIHKTFYDRYDKMEAGRVPDLKKVIPDVRRKVLKDTRLVFSGLVPTHIKLEQSKAYQVAKSLGATVTQDLEDKTTHLVAVRPGTAKVNAGRRKKNLRIVTPDWLWACAERWDKVEEKLYTLNNKGSKNRHPPPHCSSPEHNSNFEDAPETSTRKRTPSGRFMDTINPLMSFSSADIADMDREVEDIFNESESDGESSKKPEKEVDEVFVQDFKKSKESDESSSSSEESLTGEHPHGWRPTKNPNKRRRSRDDDVEDESTADEFPSTKFRRGEELSSDLDIGQESNSEGSAEAPDEIDDGDWNMMGAALEREFLSNN